VTGCCDIDTAVFGHQACAAITPAWPPPLVCEGDTCRAQHTITAPAELTELTELTDDELRRDFGKALALAFTPLPSPPLAGGTPC